MRDSRSRLVLIAGTRTAGVVGEDGAVSDPVSQLPPWFRPTAQVAAGLVVTDDDDRVLLVQPTYNDRWQLPGGVVEDGESPATAAVREVEEELGLAVEAGRLLGVDYRPPGPGGRGNALRFVVAGARLTNEQLASIVVQPDEITDWKFVALDQLDTHVIPVVASRLRHMLNDGHSYLEEGEPLRGWT